MERHLHALYPNGCTSRKPLLTGALFHFSKPFKENSTVPFSSNIRKRRYTTRHSDSKISSTQHRTLDRESPEKTKL
ncbi:hypothetical protein AHAS_Ahas15G0179000 [Arachis hypogaea]